MKMFYMFFALILSALTLAGCSSCPCKKSTVTSAPAAVAVPAATVAPVVVQEPAPVVAETAEEVVEEEIPATTRKYVSK